jgi:hypothetical protein
LTLVIPISKIIVSASLVFSGVRIKRESRGCNLITGEIEQDIFPLSDVNKAIATAHCGGFRKLTTLISIGLFR